MCHRLERHDVHLLGHDNFYLSSGFGTIYIGENMTMFT